MLYALIGLVIFVLVYGPQLWVRYVLHKHQREIPDIPGTGSELARHLLDRFELSQVEVKAGGKGENYYQPGDNYVSLSPEVFKGKSITAVAVAAHEVGHALQFNRQEPVSHLREKYFGKAILIQRIGMGIVSLSPLIGVLVKVPQLSLLILAAGVISLFISVLMYVAILPEEFDASFNKALPILAEGYVPEQNLPKIRQVLRACALTYVAAALADVLSLWRWLRLLR